MSDYGKIYIGSILLEKNRWSKEKTPTLQVSDWAGRFARDGLDGIELWEYHATLTDEGERGKLDGTPCPIAVFNSYAAMTDADDGRRAAHADLALRYGARGIKFNVGNDPAARDDYLKNVMRWRDALGGRVELLCECHPGTIIEEPAAARKFFDTAGLEGIGVIVHAFNAADTLDEWFRHFGDKVRHAHLQSRRGRDVVNFADDEAAVKKALALMTDAGFTSPDRPGGRGSFTLEFTQGTLTEQDNPDWLYAAALRDFHYLTSLLGC